MRTASLALLALPSLVALALAGPARAQDAEAPAGREEQTPKPLREPPPSARSAEPARSRALGLGLADTKGGVRITSLDLHNPSAALLEPNDVVVSVDTHPVRNAAELRDYLAALSPGEPVLLEVRRRGQARYVGVQLTEAPPPARPSTARPGTNGTTGAASGEAPAGGRGGTVIQVVPSAPSPAMPPVIVTPGGGGGVDTDLGMRPPAFSAPGMPQVPGATMPPPAGTPGYAYPQIPGVSQPPGFVRPPLAGPVSPQPFAPGGPTGLMGTTPATPLPPGSVTPGVGSPGVAAPGGIFPAR